MSLSAAPMDVAFEALARRAEGALLASGFLARESKLEIEPESSWEPEPQDNGLGAGQVLSAAAIFQIQAAPVRQLSGGARTHYVVEGEMRLELASCGPTAQGVRHKDRLAAALDTFATVFSDDVTLGGACERIMPGSDAYDDLPPDGLKRVVSVIVRVRAGDPYGRLPLEGASA